MKRALELRTILGRNVRERREFRKWSQFVLAEKAKVSPNTICDIESGKNFAREKTLINLAIALETEVYELLKPKGVLPDKPADILAQYSGQVMETLEEIGNFYIEKMKG